jgi:hypothetical protein
MSCHPSSWRRELRAVPSILEPSAESHHARRLVEDGVSDFQPVESELVERPLGGERDALRRESPSAKPFPDPVADLRESEHQTNLPETYLTNRETRLIPEDRPARGRLVVPRRFPVGDPGSCLGLVESSHVPLLDLRLVERAHDGAHVSLNPAAQRGGASKQHRLFARCHPAGGNHGRHETRHRAHDAMPPARTRRGSPPRVTPSARRGARRMPTRTPRRRPSSRECRPSDPRRESRPKRRGSPGRRVRGS